MTLDSKKDETRFCWLDLASSSTRKAEEFYAYMFGWQAQHNRVNGGEYTCFVGGGEAIASLYQLAPRQLAAGVPSHWTPYVSVHDVDEMASRARSNGGQVVVSPFSFDGVARVSLIVDPTGALIGLWERWK